MKHLFLPALFVMSAACQQPATPQVQQLSGDSLPPEPVKSNVQVVLTELDTITIGGQLYDIEDASQEEFDAIPGMLADTSETRTIAKAEGLVERRGDSLVFRLDNGQEKTLVNNLSDNDDYAEYHYQGYIPQLRHWVVYNGGYEWFSYDLVSKSDGKMLSTIGIPQLSPDGKHFICSNSDLIAGFTENGFELYEYRQGKIFLVQSRQLNKWGPVAIKWKHAGQLLANMIIVNQDMEESTRYVRLTPR
ncbi:hypothetical protein [Chitinophaga cymbidii]|uniref:Lipoprotein n=1 Tax=Chitinophaga cymbidii TaxID=1096750 RepID=A0A512RQF7_9BACT|nr:hypothetical protein [Chitinophaga cymbidii]GEP97931.1 hypothetical protein CCY01nite_41910 [Chitinophaga cymbidii]